MATATSALEPGCVVNARYRVESKIGQGGMGAVYLVRHVHTDEQLAMKVLHPQVLRNEEAVARFRREARAPAKISSEHVARVTDADTAKDLDDAPFYVMEYLRGEDLDHVLNSTGPIPPALVVEYVLQTARALDKAHPLGIVHRDLKPENLFLTHREDGSPCIKLLDFGIARLGDTDGPQQMKTAEGFVFGTPSFMSPEQTTGSVDLIGPGTDIWALGLLTFKLLTNIDFWKAQNLQHLYAMILQLPIPTPTERGSTLGPAFDAWFARCVARDIGDRFTTAGEAAVALGDALGVRVERRPSSVSLAAALPYAGDGSSSWRIVPGAVQAPSDPAGTSAPVPVTAMSVAAVQPGRSRVKLFAAVGGGLAALLLVAGVFFIVERSTRPPPPPARIISNANAPTSAVLPSERSSPPAEPADSASAAATEVGASTPTPVVDPAAMANTPAPAEPGKPRQAGARPADTAAVAKAAAAAPLPPNMPPGRGEAPVTRDQRRRLEALQRLCDQGTFTAAECSAKRAGILRGAN